MRGRFDLARACWLSLLLAALGCAQVAGLDRFESSDETEGSAVGDGDGDDPGDGDGDGDASGGASGDGDGDSSGGLAGDGDGDGDGSGGAGVGGTPTGSGGMMLGAGGTIPDPPPQAACFYEDACGGSPEGRWTVSSSCLPMEGAVDVTSIGIGCVSARITGGQLATTGTLTFMDGSYLDQTQTTGTVEFQLEAPCLDVSGTIVTCDTVSAPLTSLGFASVDCFTSMNPQDGCECTGQVLQSGDPALPTVMAAYSGEFTTMGDELYFWGGNDTKYYYCVENDVLRITPLEAPKIDPSPGEIVFVRSGN